MIPLLLLVRQYEVNEVLVILSVVIVVIDFKDKNSIFQVSVKVTVTCITFCRNIDYIKIRR